MAEVPLSGLLTKTYGTTLAFDAVSMTVPDGAFAVLLGPTGAGKTATLRPIAGRDRPGKDDIAIGRASVLDSIPARRDVATVFQQYPLYPDLTVRDILAFPLRSPIITLSEDQIIRRVAEVAKVLRIPHKLDNKATALSGGEVQRVSIGRALVRALVRPPRTYPKGDPLASLDAKLRTDLRVKLRRTHPGLKATFLDVTHDQIGAVTMATHVGVLDRGKLVRPGTPREICESPVSACVASRLGQPHINLLPGEAIPAAPPGAAQIGFRPEHIHHGEGRPASARRVERLGDRTRLHLTLGPHESITLSDAPTSLCPGDSLPIRPQNPRWFDASGKRH